MGEYKKSRYSRREVKRINDNYINMHCRITDREKRLLKIIYDRKLVRRDQLEVISDDYRKVGKSRTRVLNRSINKMFKNMCIDKVHEPQDFMMGGKPATIGIDRAGSFILGVRHVPRIKHRAEVVNGSEYIFRELPLNYRHTLGINNLEVEIINILDEKNELYIDNWTLEKSFRAVYNGLKLDLVSDVLFRIKSSQNVSYELLGIIEYDTGTESARYIEPKIIKNKISNYKKLYMSNIWRDELDSFPILIFVTNSIKRASYFSDECERVGLIGVGCVEDNFSNIMRYLLKSF